MGEHSHPVMQWRPDRPRSIDTLQVVFKVAERCNINCTYCYYFNMGDTTPFDRPAKVSPDVAADLGRWIAQGCAELEIPRVRISMHGGEPMLLGPRRFSEVCDVLEREIAPVAQLDVSIQTNGTILNDDWLAVFARHRVRVGVSIDGTEVEHDRFRLDHQGRSTFAATASNLRRLVAAAHGDPAWLPSTISVLDHRADYRRVYAFLRDIGVEAMTFLFPDRNADDRSFRASPEADAMGDRLVELVDAWFAEDNPNVSVRFIDRALGHLRLDGRPGPARRPRKAVQVVVARSDGTVTVDDSYIPALEWYSTSPVYDVKATSLATFLADPIFLQIERLNNTSPTACASCPWLAMCGGGDLENRYATTNGFDNPSIYCDSLKAFYAALCSRLIARGYPANEVKERFGELAIAS